MFQPGTFLFCVFSCSKIFLLAYKHAVLCRSGCSTVIVMLTFVYIFTKSFSVLFHLFIQHYNLEMNCYSYY